MYYKFNSKLEAFNFVKLVNEGENIVPSLENTTDSYCQPIVFMGEYYIFKDEITSKYTDLEPVEIENNESPI